MTEAGGDKPTARVGDYLRAEHAQVRALAQQIGAAQDVAALRPILSEYRRMLEHHFSAEEARDGLYDAVMAEAPERAHELGMLRAQHAELLEKIARLQELIERYENAPADAVLDHARGLAAQLQKHESAESDLLLEVFNTDLGTGN